MHVCYACNTANPHRAIHLSHSEAATVRVPARFAGPPGAANGGIAVGLLSCPALQRDAYLGHAPNAVARITARLRRSLPLDAPLTALAAPKVGMYESSFGDGDGHFIEGRVEVMRLDAPARPGDALASVPEDRADVIASMSRVVTPERPPFWEETGEHPIRGCFSCGPDNAEGMHIFPRLTDEDGTICSNWQPDPSFEDANGALSSMIIASALDCSSGICMPLALQQELLEQDRFFLLGSLDVRYLRVAPVDAPGGYRVVGRALQRDGRKFYGLSALFDASDTPYAIAEATWIVASVTRTEAFGAR